jgi:hypothetical protein
MFDRARACTHAGVGKLDAQRKYAPIEIMIRPRFNTYHGSLFSAELYGDIREYAPSLTWLDARLNRPGAESTPAGITIARKADAG